MRRSSGIAGISLPMCCKDYLGANSPKYCKQHATGSELGSYGEAGKSTSSHIGCGCAVAGTSAHRWDGLLSTQNKLKVDLKIKKSRKKNPAICPPGEIQFAVNDERAWMGRRAGHLMLLASAQVDPWSLFRNRSKWDSVCPHHDQMGG